MKIGRSMIAPTAIDFCSDETITRGTGKPVPYNVRCKTQHCTNVWRQFSGFIGNFDTGIPEIYVSVGAPMRL